MTTNSRLLLWPAAALVGAVLFLGSAIAVFAASVSQTGGNTPGAALSVSGSGFQANEPILLMLGLSNGSATADASGSFSGAPLTIPNVPSGTYIVIAVGQNSGFVAFSYLYISSFFPNASPSAWWIAPGSTLTWSGTGFAPNESVTLWRGADILATFSADGSGAFNNAGSSIVPYSLRNSSGTYTLQGAVTGTLSYTITVSDLYPYANPSTWYAPPGTQVTFTGSGFGPNETVNLYLGTGTTVLASATTDATGAFLTLGPTNLPFGSSAPYRIVGASSGASANVPITLASFYPTLTPSSYYSAPGAFISLGGSGFADNEPISLMIGASSTSATADNIGAFTLPSVQVPSTPNTPATISAVGGLSGAAASFTMAIGQYYPDIVPSLWFSYPGDTVAFSGSGFAPNETLTVSGAGSGSISTDGTGSFTGYASTLPSSNATYTFTGSSSLTPFAITIALGQRVSAIWFDNYWGVGGSALTVFGAGFGNGEQVDLSEDGTTFATATADSAGSFSHLTAMPFAPAGPLTVTATGATTGSITTADTNVAPIWPTLTFGSYAVAPGQALQIIGSGYLANEPMEVVIDGSVVGTFSADASGSFDNSSVTLPSLSEGLHDIVVRGTHSFHESTITIWVLAS